MIARVHDDLGLWPRKLIGDTGYGSADMLAWLVNERDIEPHIPLFDHSSRSDGIFERAAFVFDHDRDQYDCPGRSEEHTSELQSLMLNSSAVFSLKKKHI